MQKSIFVCVLALLSLLLTATAAGSDGSTTPPTNGNAENDTVDKSNNSTGNTSHGSTTPPTNGNAENDTVDKSNNSTGNTTHETQEVVKLSNGIINSADNNTKVPPTTPEDPNCSPQILTTRGFDGASFIGGIVLALGLLAIGFMGFKYYKNRTGRAFHQAI